jgi:protoporphyrinogen oxidase
MRDIVIIGAGLSGLAAAYELEQHNAAYSLIEVKRHLGGSLHSVEQDGFMLDTGAFALADTLDREWLASVGLAADATLHELERGVAFNQGAGTLINALAERIDAPRMMRMAVSSIGELDELKPQGKLGLCLENGLLLDAKSVIVAAPARYAERMFYSLRPEVSKQLRQYRYDALLRVNLGFLSADVPETLALPPDLSYCFLHRTSHPQRTPPEHTLLQFGLRLKAGAAYDRAELVRRVCRQFDLPPPVTQRVHYWPEADALSIHDDDHATTMQAIQAALPPNVALIGSDYSIAAPPPQGLVRLDDRIQQGRQAARRMLRMV